MNEFGSLSAVSKLIGGCLVFLRDAPERQQSLTRRLPVFGNRPGLGNPRRWFDDFRFIRRLWLAIVPSGVDRKAETTSCGKIIHRRCIRRKRHPGLPRPCGLERVEEIAQIDRRPVHEISFDAC